MTPNDRSHSDRAGSDTDPLDSLAALAQAARDWRPVIGWTHNFYRYPARFSPQFAAAVLEQFSQRGDLVLDPYMGGGTAIVEGMARGRLMVGNDLNSLAAFITKVKITRLTRQEVHAVRSWASEQVPSLRYSIPGKEVAQYIDPQKTKNLTVARGRFIKKIVAAALSAIAHLRSEPARDFARCVLLCVGQWALDGRSRHTSLEEFRSRVATTCDEMLVALIETQKRIRRSGGRATLLNMNAADLADSDFFRKGGDRASLVITSPPYPGVHVLYHRWQVDGRRETPAPYWITGCNDGQGAAFYNFGDRRQGAADRYFNTSLITLKGIRRVIKDGGHMVQMVAFNRPDEQLPRYLANMQLAGFEEVQPDGYQRIWRAVPNRKWHANLRGRTHGANEVVLIHRAS